MINIFTLSHPKVQPALDETFQPAALVNRSFRDAVAQDGVPLVIALERSQGKISRYETNVFPEGHPEFEVNLPYVERIVKFLLWQRGGFKVYVGGARAVGEHIAACYSLDGSRQFDYQFMGMQVYEQTFQVVPCSVDDVP